MFTTQLAKLQREQSVIAEGARACGVMFEYHGRREQFVIIERDHYHCITLIFQLIYTIVTLIAIFHFTYDFR